MPPYRGDAPWSELPAGVAVGPRGACFYKHKGVTVAIPPHVVFPTKPQSLDGASAAKTASGIFISELLFLSHYALAERAPKALHPRTAIE